MSDYVFPQELEQRLDFETLSSATRCEVQPLGDGLWCWLVFLEKGGVVRIQNNEESDYNDSDRMGGWWIDAPEGVFPMDFAFYPDAAVFADEIPEAEEWRALPAVVTAEWCISNPRVAAKWMAEAIVNYVNEITDGEGI